MTEKSMAAGNAAHTAERIQEEAEIGSNARQLRKWESQLFFWGCVAFTVFHLYVLNVYPIDPWLFRTAHVAFGISLGFMIFAATARQKRPGVAWYDWVFIVASIACFVYIFDNLDGLLFRAGAAPTTWDVVFGVIGTLLILEITRRSAGLALPIISVVFLLYCVAGPIMPGVLYHKGIRFDHLFSFIYSLEGVFGPTTAVSSTYIILFITFAGFLQASKIGDYFVNFSFSLAGTARGGPAKVAVMSSALMGTINGTSAGNVAATGTFTIPMMKKVGYPARSAGAIEAAASTGGQIMPPVMGAGAFIMAEITGIPYTDIMIAAVMPALLYFVAVYFMVDNEAKRLNMHGLPRSELPRVDEMLRRVFLFIPLIVLIGGLVLNYSVIRSGTLAMASALVISWILPDTRMGARAVFDALHLGAKGTIQLIAVCACAGIIVGVIGLTGIGLRFSSMILAIAGESQFLALVFAMAIAVVLGMGMPTTAAYAVAASVVAPGLVKLGISPLVAHMFVFYYAVLSAITPPVALAGYAGAAIAGSDPMKTSVTSFIYGLAAFIVPFMFFYSPALLAQGDWVQIVHYGATACIGVYLLAGALQSWYFGRIATPLRVVLFAGSLLLIYGGVMTDLAGLAIAIGVGLWQQFSRKAK
ncbi:MAG TPA: TRAP transporter permease [Ferrovibrio sp.]|uniref:TRAP transporter permease n=1 Tax=Ferrovibrio sp. TaxID=1917215 RepID=UPI002B4AD4D5|nr:TRAP transporter permease [Ferrovibrio sp.]HLT78317.1 TRAP transporter permease [Ferrovibrio sp.]